MSESENFQPLSERMKLWSAEELRIFNSVKAVIDDWDPIDLLSHAPNDEYDSETEEIARLVKLTKDINELASGIYSVFFEAFDGGFVIHQSECVNVSQKILASICGK